MNKKILFSLCFCVFFLLNLELSYAHHAEHVKDGDYTYYSEQFLNFTKSKLQEFLNLSDILVDELTTEEFASLKIERELSKDLFHRLRNDPEHLTYSDFVYLTLKMNHLKTEFDNHIEINRRSNYFYGIVEIVPVIIAIKLGWLSIPMIIIDIYLLNSAVYRFVAPEGEVLDRYILGGIYHSVLEPFRNNLRKWAGYDDPSEIVRENFSFYEAVEFHDDLCEVSLALCEMGTVEYMDADPGSLKSDPGMKYPKCFAESLIDE